jgi:predicted nucleotidyltransferase
MGDDMTKAEILDLLNKKKPYLAKNFGVESIALFGSYARDEADEDSDIDIVIHASVKSFTNRYNLKRYLEEVFKKPVDIGYYDSLRTFIKKEIEKDLIYV